MKKIMFISLLFFSLKLHAQKIDTTALKRDSIHLVTAFGDPDGKIACKEIGPAGDSIISDDGRVELIFPEGALDKNTLISIQPTKNLAPNGTGKSYQFEPSGIQFAKPVQFIFRYTEEEADLCPPDLMGIAMQDHDGKWSFFDYDDWDSAGGILKGSIHHFSGVTNVNKLRLEADKNLGVWQKSLVYVIDISRFFKGAYESATFLDKQYRLWFANNILGGDNANGVINDESVWAHDDYFYAVAAYRAPKVLPAKNAVKVTLQVYILKGKNNVSSFQKSLSCYILIYEDYDIHVSMEMGKGFGGMEWVDESSFIMRVGKDVAIVEGSVKNQNLDVKGSTGCARYINKATCTGPIHITGISKFKLTPGKPFTKVEIFFDVSGGVIIPQFEVNTCPGGIGPPTPLVLTQRYPFRMTFFLTDKPVLLSLWKANGGVVDKEDPNDIIVKIEPPNWDENE